MNFQALAKLIKRDDVSNDIALQPCSCHKLLASMALPVLEKGHCTLDELLQ